MTYSELPFTLQSGMQMYLDKRIAPGSFLLACLCNDWLKACCYADPDNVHKMHVLAMWLIAHAPVESYGSPTKVANWLGRRNHVEVV